MAKKKPKPKQKPVFFDGNLLRSTDDPKMLERKKLLGRTTLRRARYWCYRFRNEETGGATADDAPAGFKKAVESMPGFMGWDLFADKWDIVGDNPFMIVYRLMSVWQEWDQVMERVAIPIDSSPAEVAARMRILEHQYKG
jgi:hypothetical protein